MTAARSAARPVRRSRDEPGPARPPHVARTGPGRYPPDPATATPPGTHGAGPSQPARPSCRTQPARRPGPAPGPAPHPASRGRGTRSGRDAGMCSFVASKTSRSEPASPDRTAADNSAIGTLHAPRLRSLPDGGLLIFHNVFPFPATAAANSHRWRSSRARTHRGCPAPPRKIPPDGHFRVTPCPLWLRSVQSTKTAREEGADDRDQARSSAERHGRDEPAGLERAQVSAGTGAARYEIRVDGVLDRRWTTWFEGLEVDNDGSQTVISGEIADQAALHGLLNKVCDLGLTLISVHRSGPD